VLNAKCRYAAKKVWFWQLFQTVMSRIAPTFRAWNQVLHVFNVHISVELHHTLFGSWLRRTLSGDLGPFVWIGWRYSHFIKWSALTAVTPQFVLIKLNLSSVNTPLIYRRPSDCLTATCLLADRVFVCVAVFCEVLRLKKGWQQERTLNSPCPAAGQKWSRHRWRPGRWRIDRRPCDPSYRCQTQTEGSSGCWPRNAEVNCTDGER